MVSRKASQNAQFFKADWGTRAQSYLGLNSNFPGLGEIFLCTWELSGFTYWHHKYGTFQPVTLSTFHHFFVEILSRILDNSGHVFKNVYKKIYCISLNFWQVSIKQSYIVFFLAMQQSITNAIPLKKTKWGKWRSIVLLSSTKHQVQQASEMWPVSQEKRYFLWFVVFTTCDYYPQRARWLK